MSKARQRVPVGQSGDALRQPLPGLAALRDQLPRATTVPPPAAAATPPAVPPGPAAETTPRSIYARAARIVVRRERKGHGGKTATRIEGIVASPRELEAALRDIKRALGCGAALDGGDIIVQGAQGERLIAFLEARGARKVTVGS